MRIGSCAVNGSGDRDEDAVRGAACRSRALLGGALAPPAVDEVWLEQLELPRLALDALLGGGVVTLRFWITELPTRPK